MAQHHFTATHGVTLQDEDGVIWAQFVDDRSLAKPDGTRVYVFSTKDNDVAKRVAKVKGYGIAEVDAPAAEPDPEPAPTPDAPAAGPEQPAGNASLEAWQEYGKAKGQDVEGKTRDEIRALFA